MPSKPRSARRLPAGWTDYLPLAISLSLACLALFPAMGRAAAQQPVGGEETDQPKVFRDSLPDEVTTEIAERLAEAQAAPQEPEEILQALRHGAESLPLSRDTDRRRQQVMDTRRLFCERRSAAVPILEEYLRSPELQMRRRAVCVLAGMLKPHEYLDEEYMAFELRFLAPLLLRSLHDVEPEMRMRAVLGLGFGMGVEHLPSPSDRIPAALIPMISDEDPRVVFHSAMALYLMGHGDDLPPELLEEIKSGPIP